MILLIGDTVPKPSSYVIAPRGFQRCTPHNREGTPGSGSDKPHLGAEELPRVRCADTYSSTGAARLLVELDVNQDIHSEA